MGMKFKLHLEFVKNLYKSINRKKRSATVSHLNRKKRSATVSHLMFEFCGSTLSQQALVPALLSIQEICMPS